MRKKCVVVSYCFHSLPTIYILRQLAQFWTPVKNYKPSRILVDHLAENKSKPSPIKKLANDKSSQPSKNKCDEKIPELTL